jgi:hypothetical protein
MPDGWEELTDPLPSALVQELWDHLRHYRDLQEAMDTAISWRVLWSEGKFDGAEAARNAFIVRVDEYVKKWIHGDKS